MSTVATSLYAYLPSMLVFTLVDGRDGLAPHVAKAHIVTIQTYCMTVIARQSIKFTTPTPFRLAEKLTTRFYKPILGHPT
jgi:hypothetical protein